jgi:hypothetical protein
MDEAPGIIHQSSLKNPRLYEISKMVVNPKMKLSRPKGIRSTDFPRYDALNFDHDERRRAKIGK